MLDVTEAVKVELGVLEKKAQKTAGEVADIRTCHPRRRSPDHRSGHRSQPVQAPRAYAGCKGEVVQTVSTSIRVSSSLMIANLGEETIRFELQGSIKVRKEQAAVGRRTAAS